MLEFNIPTIKSKFAEDERDGTFVIEPLERGYGITLGNSLRRVMLSSLPGAAVAYIKIDGVLHEFSTIPGVTEDVCEIVLNVKGIVAKLYTEGPKTAIIDVVGPRVVTAADIRADADLEIIDPTHKIATVDDGTRFYMELTFVSGRGYVSADQNKQHYAPNTIGVIPVDSIFTPVYNVNYEVENTRVGSQTDFDRLTIEIKTDGSITPTDAMAISSDIMIKHFELISALSDTSTKPVMRPDRETQITAMLDTSIDDLEFSVRSYNCLKRAGINTVADMISRTELDMMKIRNLGKKSFDEIKDKLRSMGQSFREEE